MKQYNILGEKLVALALVVALLATIVFSTSVILADGTKVNFPDHNLELAIREAINKPTGDIYDSDLSGLTFLNASGRDIRYLGGLEHCTSLGELYLGGNQISDITLLSNLTSLIRLDLYHNEISNIAPLSSLTSLLYLYLENNEISDITPLANLTNLRKLSVGGNPIGDISSLVNLTHLTYLYLYGSQISNIASLSNLTELTELYLSNNQISDISSLASLTNLTNLALYDNQVSDITPLANLTSLERLSLRNNQISEVSALSALTELRTLYLDDNQIVDIGPLSSLNKLGDIEYVGWLEVREGNYICLGLQNNQIDDIAPLVSNEGLSGGDGIDDGIDLRGNPLSCESYGTLLPQLEGRGVVVLYDVSTFPSQPTNTSPIDGTTDISLTPLLQSSAFSDPEGDAHAASQWQIRTSTESYDSPVFDSGTDTANKTQITIPSGKLTYSTTYYWRVRYQDSQMNWSCWSTETSFTTVPNQPPSQPTNTSPADGTTDVSLTPLLQSSAFSDPEGDAHAASQWQIRSSSGDYSNPVFDSGEDTTNLTQITIPSGKLDYLTGYYWKVRYQDSYGGWSDWSAETSFITIANQPPSQPHNLLPVDEDTGVSLTPHLQSLAFSDPNAGDTHTASQWQITTTLGDYSSPVFDSGEDTHNLTSITIPSEILTYSTTYYWRVRYQDNNGAWSDWSSETSFVTEAEEAGLSPWVWVVVALVGAVLLATGVIAGDRLARRWKG